MVPSYAVIEVADMAWYVEKAMDLLTKFTDFADFCGDGDPIVIFEDASKWGLGSQRILPAATLSATRRRWGRQRQERLYDMFI
jgi:hypothetical protein